MDESVTRASMASDAMRPAAAISRFEAGCAIEELWTGAKAFAKGREIMRARLIHCIPYCRFPSILLGGQAAWFPKGDGAAVRGGTSRAAPILRLLSPHIS